MDQQRVRSADTGTNIGASIGELFAKVQSFARTFGSDNGQESSQASAKKLDVSRRADHTAGISSAEPIIRSVFWSCRKAFIAIGIFSGISSILMLTGSFYMLQVYDRVLPSRNVPTLIALSVLAVLLYSMQGGVDFVRARLSARIGRFFDVTVSPRVYDATVRLSLKTRGSSDDLQPLRDLDAVRGFLCNGATTFFDLPWLPLYLGLCFVFHYWIGITALVGMCVLVGLTIVTELRVRTPTKAAAALAKVRIALATGTRRNAEAVVAMGMFGRLAARWSKANHEYLLATERANDIAGGLAGISKVCRMILQSAVLGVGAYLVIHQEATAGIIIASSIITSRALAPVDMAIGHWKGFVASRQAANRLNQLLVVMPEQATQLELPAPRQTLSVQGLCVSPPGFQKMVVNDVTFDLNSGQGLGIIGPTGSGKSSLARALVGVWQPARGKVRIDGGSLDQWTSATLGMHVGYLPQDVELFEGTVAMNIARFDSDADAKTIVAAAEAACAHKLILSLPAGYSTEIGENGTALSAGQRQRIALARALYRDPFLVVLDEPNSNLDAEGDEALTRAILNVRSRGGIVVIIAHRPSALVGVDHVLVMGEGRSQSFGPKDEVLRRSLQNQSVMMPQRMTIATNQASTR